MQVDYLVIGGGIVGLSSAMQILQAKPGATLLLLEKEDGVARHQTGRNSGVIHAGVYYQPGSLKAEYCRIGSTAIMTFCGEHAIPFEQCGKLIVATDALELARMGALEERCTRNQIKIERLDAQELRNREPNIIGNGALYVPSSGIVDYGLVARVMAQEVERLGGVLIFNAKLRRITEGANTVAVETDRETYQAKSLVVCGGLHADALAHMAGLETDWTMVPFRGEYFKLPDAKADIVKHLIYPVPNPDLPFLGVHLTKLAGGGQTLGPNAMLAFGREAYRKTDFNAADVAGFAAFPGFWKLMGKHWKSAAAEAFSSLSKHRYAALSRKYCPDIDVKDLLPYRSGVRAQVVKRDGTMVHDFMIEKTARMVHVFNAPSPAATSSLPIGRRVAQEAGAIR